MSSQIQKLHAELALHGRDSLLLQSCQVIFLFRFSCNISSLQDADVFICVARSLLSGEKLIYYDAKNYNDVLEQKKDIAAKKATFANEEDFWEQFQKYALVYCSCVY
jgi:hypothetical protein